MPGRANAAFFFFSETGLTDRIIGNRLWAHEQMENIMSKPADFETRSLMVLQEEVTRAAATVERVRLVVQAMAQRRGLASRELVRDASYDFGA